MRAPKLHRASAPLILPFFRRSFRAQSATRSASSTANASSFSPQAGSIHRRPQKKTPRDRGEKNLGGVLLSHDQNRTTIGDETFHVPVRNGKGWGRLSMAAKKPGQLPAIHRAKAQPRGEKSKSELASKNRRSKYGATMPPHDYGIKPHSQLVPVSYARYRASTSGLSTLCSSRDFQEGQALGRSSLGAGFPLRCFQRLSFPNIATRRCRWRDNRNTRGSSTPVLSY